jgi:hypothetical protein
MLAGGRIAAGTTHDVDYVWPAGGFFSLCR